MDTPLPGRRGALVEPPAWFPEPIEAAEVSAQTTVGLFLLQAERLQHRPMVHDLSHGAWEGSSWCDMKERAGSIACALVAAGVTPGDRVILLSEDRVTLVACQLAVQMAGGVTVPLDPGVEAGVAQAAAQETGAVLAIASSEASASKLHLTGTLGRIVRLDGAVTRWSRARPEKRPYDEIIRRLRRLDSGDGASVVHKSDDGASLQLSHRDLVGAARLCVTAMGIRAADSLLSMLPASRVVQRTLSVSIAMAAGAPLWLWPGLEHSAAAVASVRPTVVLGVPEVLDELWERARRDIGRRSRLKQAVLCWALSGGGELRDGMRLAWGHRPRAGLARLVLGPLRGRIGGGRLRLFVSGGGLLTPEVEAFFRVVGMPVSLGCLELPAMRAAGAIEIRSSSGADNRLTEDSAR